MTLAVMDRERAIMAEDLAQFVHDPLACSLYAFPWGKS